MVFHPPTWVPKVDVSEIPDDIPISDFIFEDRYGRHPLAKSRPFFTDAISGDTISPVDLKRRVDHLARGLADVLGWKPNQGTEWDKVVGVWAANTLDNMPLAWAAHRLGGIQSPANAQYNVSEVAFQLKDSGAKCVFTVLPLLKQTLEAAAKVGIPKDKIFLLEMPAVLLGGAKNPPGFLTVDDLVKRGEKLPELEKLNWKKGDGKRKTAFLCYSSGTSGLPKGVMISHHNVISNVVQVNRYDDYHRKQLKNTGEETYLENSLGLLPMSHIYSVVVICHCAPYRGDGVIILPKFEIDLFLRAIQDYKINGLFLVPPIVILMAKNKDKLKQYDLSSVATLFSGAAPLGQETIDELLDSYPDWIVRQGYGLTETATVVTSTSGHDLWGGSCGSILPGVAVKLVDPVSLKEVTGYGEPGEIWVQGPAVTLGYLNRREATEETYVEDKQGRWMRTGDEGVVKKAPSGNEHLFITDRIKELIKVKGLQVAPAELEAHLLNHPHVADVCVIAVPDDRAGEVPKAYVVKSRNVGLEESDVAVKRGIAKHVEKEKSRHKWLKGGIEFIDEIPKSPSGKILRRVLRDKEKAERKKKGAKL